MVTALIAILSVVGSYALDYTVNFIQEIQAKNLKVTPGTISAVLNRAIAEARSKGQKVYNSLTRDLSKIQGLSNYATGTVRDILQNASANYGDKLKKVEERMTDLENKATEAQTRAQDISSETTTSRLNNADQYKRELADYTKQIQSIEKDISEVK